MASALDLVKNRNFENAAPMTALLELTFVCNHACSFCYNCPTGQKEMNTVEVMDAMRKLADFNVLYLTLTGGEPLVRRDFFEIAAAAREMGFAIRIYTNGYLIDEAMAARLKQVANPLEVEISIHGANDETHERVTCVPGSLQRVLNAVRFLRAQGIRVNLKCPVTRANQEEVLAIQALADEVDAYAIFDPIITPRDDGDKDPLNSIATDEFLARYWLDPAYARARNEDVPKPRCDAPGAAVCGTGRSALAIDPYGNIYPCVQWRRKVANIKDLTTLGEIWKSSAVLKEVRQTAVDIAQETLKDTEDGQFTYFCAGVADLQTGDPKTIYPQIAKNAEFRRKAYEAWRKKSGESAGDTGGVSAPCEL